jgi:GMP synthase (glutamine-hydrolysing)
MEPDRVVVLDFGGQYAHLIARRIRQLKVYSEILPATAPSSALKNAKGIILSGGPNSVYEKNAPKYNKQIFGLGIPVLGLCYGQQLMAHHLGGLVKPGTTKEYGIAQMKKERASALTEGLSAKEQVWMSHGDSVQQLPKGFERIGSTIDCENAAIQDVEKKLFGLQFHPEVTHTPNGMKILENFVLKICKAERNWSMDDYADKKAVEIRQKAGKKKVFLLASGGVDSSVALALLQKALPLQQLFALHVDTGFMRKNESEEVEGSFSKLGIKNFKVLRVGNEFFAALKGVVEPEQKRKIIGKKFVEVMQAELKKMGVQGKGWVLCQGTIYPDRIETAATKHASKIKTHHNRAPIIEQLEKKGMVIEPINELYKDEVRELGKKLGLPDEVVKRQPFPGPGLAIRALCSNGKGNVDKKAENVLKEIANDFGYRARILPVKAVGVQGDARSYKNVALLEGKLNWGKLEECSTRITNNVKAVNRVVYLVQPEKVSEIKLIKAHLMESRIARLQEADAISMKIISEKGLYDKIWQFPVVLLPLDVDGKGEAIVLRPVFSLEAMTARFAEIDEKVVQEIAGQIMKIKGIGAVMYDVTHKPPATIEWE